MKRLIFILCFSFLLTNCSLFKTKELPVLGQLPEFQLIDQEGKPKSLKAYEGKIWAANFIFTSCAGTCPLLTQQMKHVQEALLHVENRNPNHPFRIVSFSVDPERDTPEKLAKYARGYGVKNRLWSFLTGPVDTVTATVVEGFKISMGKVPVDSQGATEAEKFDVVHGEKFVLVDQKGQIRAYYEARPSGVEKLIRDMKNLNR